MSINHRGCSHVDRQAFLLVIAVYCFWSCCTRKLLLIDKLSRKLHTKSSEIIYHARISWLQLDHHPGRMVHIFNRRKVYIEHRLLRSHLHPNESCTTIFSRTMKDKNKFWSVVRMLKGYLILIWAKDVSSLPLASSKELNLGCRKKNFFGRMQTIRSSAIGNPIVQDRIEQGRPM